MASSIKGITVEIGGNTTGLDKALKDVNKTINTTSSQLRQVNKGLKLDPTNTTLLQQKQELLAKQIDNTKSKLSTFNSLQDEVTKKYKNGEIDEGAYRAFQIELGKTESSLKDFENQAEQSTEKLSDGMKKASGTTQEVQKEVEKAGSKIEDVGKKVENVGKKMSVVSAGIVAIAGASIKSFDEVDTGYDIIVKKTGAAGEQLDSLSESMDNVFGSLPTDAETAGNAIGEINTRFAVTGDELENLSELFIEFANINDTDVTDSVAKTSKIMAQWGIDSGETADLLGLITQKSQATGISVDTLMESVQTNGATFKELGLSVTDSISLLAQFEKNGVNAEMAMAGLRKSIKNATDEGLTADEALKTTIDSIKNASSETEALQTASDLFGTKGAAEMTVAIREGRISVDDLSDSMSKYKDTVKTTFNATLDPPDKAKVALNKLKLAGAELGDALLQKLAPVIDKVSGKIEKFTSWFGSLDEKQQNNIITIGLVIAAIGPLLLIVSKVITVISTLGSALSFLAANPVVAIIGAIVLLVGTLVTLYNTNEDFRNSVDLMWSSIKETILSYVDEISTGFNNFISIFTEDIPGAIDTFAEDWSDGLISIVDNVKMFWYDVKCYFVNGINELIDDVNMIGLDFSWLTGNDNASVGFNLDHLSMPEYPKLAKGGIVSEGSAIFAEAGPEMLTVMNGKAIVQPLSSTATTTNINTTNNNSGNSQSPVQVVAMFANGKIFAQSTATYIDEINGNTVQMTERGLANGL